jgi:hypothetical protein
MSRTRPTPRVRVLAEGPGRGPGVPHEHRACAETHRAEVVGWLVVRACRARATAGGADTHLAGVVDGCVHAFFVLRAARA